MEAHFDEPDGNVAVVMGALSGNLIDIDIDCAEGLSIAPHILPETHLIFGRDSNPASHRIFQCEDESPATVKFTDTDGSVIIELRSDGHATNFPPSMHPGGEPYEFVEEGAPGEVTAAEISCAARLLATACLVDLAIFADALLDIGHFSTPLPLATILILPGMSPLFKGNCTMSAPLSELEAVNL